MHYVFVAWLSTISLPTCHVTFFFFFSPACGLAAHVLHLHHLWYRGLPNVSQLHSVPGLSSLPPPPARFSPRGLEASSINTCLPFDSRQSDGAPYIAPKVSTGASPALYGLLGCLFVELFQSWRLLESPWKELIKLTLISIVALAVGLLPYIDNWSHSTLARGSCKGHGALMLSSCSQSQRSTHLEECSLPCLVVTILT